MKRIILLSVFLFVLFTLKSFSQVRKDSADFIEYKNPFYQEILSESDRFASETKETKKVFKMGFEGMELPKSLTEFTYQWHNEPVSQGLTGTCWSFSTTSFYESEIYRIHNKKIKLSELYTVYCEYIEKAKRFIEKRGKSAFAEGSEANAVARIWKTYGTIPEDVYTGLLPGQKFHDHRKMYEEMNKYLQSVKNTNSWDEAETISTIKSILNHYIQKPPEKFNYEGREYTPKEFLQKIVNLNLDDYVDILSIKQQPYYQKVEYEVPDNWWHNSDYYNVPLDVYMETLKKILRNNYTVCIGGDVSEAGYSSLNQVAMIPSFDIPSEYIDDNARQFRFSNNTTTDDHGIHLVGWMNREGKDWYLIKDSGAGSRVGSNKGYYFYHEDYVKLKMMNFTVHKDAVIELLMKFK